MPRMIPDKSPATDSAREARQLLRAHRYGTLCTLSKKFEGHPFGSITPYLTDHDGSLVILISDLAEHTKNIKADPRVSLITHNQGSPHIQTQGRVTVLGNAHHLPDREKAGERYLRYFPEAHTYFAMHDFQFYRIVPQAIRYIGGFGNIHWVHADRYALPDYPLMTEEHALLEKLNAGRSPKLGQIIGMDCDGYDVRIGEQLKRVEAPAPLLNAADAFAFLQSSS